MAPAPSAPSANLTRGGMTKVGMTVSCHRILKLKLEYSQSVARPDRPRLECGADLLRKIRAPQQRLKNSRLHTADPAASGGNERGDDIVAETRAQGRTQVADAVGKAKLDG